MGLKPIPVGNIKSNITVDVKGKSALFIGDSHTSNHKSGWQILVCKQTKMKMNNLSVGGKTTEWMLKTARLNLSSNYDYCFIYGGANDMYSNSISIKQALKNIKQMIGLCKIYNVTPIVLTGFDPIKCTRTANPNYGPKYAKFQQILLDSIKGTKVIDTRVIDRSSCWDVLCHMNPEGHKKTADAVIAQCKFKIW
jgi:lysophospholipase L1-like esterase